MTRDWLFVRLLTPRRPLPPVLPGLTDRLRAADPGARWAFQRLDGGVGVWLGSRPDVLAELAGWLAETATRQHIPFDIDREPRRPGYPTERDGELAAALAEAASDLALAVLADGELDAGIRLLAAVHHLEHLTGLLAGGSPPTFLFHCWQHWAGALSRQTRVDLVRAADSAHLDGELPAEPWATYRARTHAIAGPDGVPGYLLLDHAHRTHDRLGITPETEALAARILRQSLTRGTPVRQAQPV